MKEQSIDAGHIRCTLKPNGDFYMESLGTVDQQLSMTWDGMQMLKAAIAQLETNYIAMQRDEVLKEARAAYKKLTGSQRMDFLEAEGLQHKPSDDDEY